MPDMLVLIKHLHVWFALVSISGFVLRFIWLKNKPQMLQKPWVRIAPHVNDTALLISGIFMAWQLGYSLTNINWLSIKLTVVVVYIIFGALTLKLQIRLLYKFVLFVASLILFSSILMLAVIKPTSL